MSRWDTLLDVILDRNLPDELLEPLAACASTDPSMQVRQIKLAVPHVINSTWQYKMDCVRMLRTMYHIADAKVVLEDIPTRQEQAWTPPIPPSAMQILMQHQVIRPEALSKMLFK